MVNLLGPTFDAAMLLSACADAIAGGGSCFVPRGQRLQWTQSIQRSVLAAKPTVPNSLTLQPAPVQPFGSAMNDGASVIDMALLKTEQVVVASNATVTVRGITLANPPLAQGANTLLQLAAFSLRAPGAALRLEDVVSLRAHTYVETQPRSRAQPRTVLGCAKLWLLAAGAACKPIAPKHAPRTSSCHLLLPPAVATPAMMLHLTAMHNTSPTDHLTVYP